MRHINERLGDSMLIGYMRISKTDGSQVLDLQKDALLNASVLPEQLYHDVGSGKINDRSGLTACLIRCRSREGKKRRRTV